MATNALPPSWTLKLTESWGESHHRSRCKIRLLCRLVRHCQSGSLWTFPDRIGVSKCCFLKDRRKLEKAKKKLSEQGRGLTSISTHKWCRFRDSVTGRREKYLISLCFVAWFYCSLGTFSIRDGSENVTFKMNWLFFKLCRVYSNFLKMSNAGKFPWSWFLGDLLVSAKQAKI